MIKVVLVEDEELIRQGMKLTMEWEKFECQVIGEATDGEEGLKVIRKLKPDIVFTDIRMPKLSGLEMMEQLKEALPVKFIILSGYDDFSYAKKAMGNAYAPYSNFYVGAAILTSEGEVFTGCNVENSSYGATICAERCAIIKAISEGYTSFTKIAIVSSGNNLTFPCGICRQFLAEFMQEDGIIVLSDSKGEIQEFELSALIPHAFNLSKDFS